MESTAAALAGVTAFARAMRPDLPAFDEALAALRETLGRAAVPYALVGGLAVIHHGYLRTTRDLDLLVDRAELERALPELESAGFLRLAEHRLRHRATGAEVDLLFAGEARPRPGVPPYPDPRSLARSEREPDVVALPALVDLKLTAGRHQDLADVVALLKPLAEDDYLRLDAALRPELRRSLPGLRRDALEELAAERRG
ncbi:MAG: nucleotidyltransferase family protein [Thermoanaerobaculia bacterium]|nr:nucleotidyltransferase family protein [Thermoanaerobaculia bacterium]